MDKLTCGSLGTRMISPRGRIGFDPWYCQKLIEHDDEHMVFKHNGKSHRRWVGEVGKTHLHVPFSEDDGTVLYIMKDALGFKVGWSQNLKQRLIDLRRLFPGIELVTTAPDTSNRRGEQALKDDWHVRTTSIRGRVSTEWFVPTQEIVDWVNKLEVRLP